MTKDLAGHVAPVILEADAGDPDPPEAPAAMSTSAELPRADPLGAGQDNRVTRPMLVRSDPHPPEAILSMTPRENVPRTDPIAGHRAFVTHEPNAGDPHLPEAKEALSPLADVPRADLEQVEAVCARIRVLHRRASFCTAQRVALGNRLAAFVRTEFLGFSTFDDEAARAKAIAAAHKLIRAARAGATMDLDPDEALALQSLVHSSDLAMAPFEELEAGCLKAMKKLARELPGHAFVLGVRGFGEVSFARIIGETGPLHRYSGPARVWKRLGLAVINGERQRRHKAVELALLHGFNAKRRSVSWVAFESLLKAQGSGETAGPYRQLYDLKKVEYTAREGWTKMHAHRAAARYAEKRLLRELWRAWRDDIGSGQNHRVTPRGHAASDPISPGLCLRVTQSARAGRDELGGGPLALANRWTNAIPEPT